MNENIQEKDKTASQRWEWIANVRKATEKIDEGVDCSESERHWEDLFVRLLLLVLRGKQLPGWLLWL